METAMTRHLKTCALAAVAALLFAAEVAVEAPLGLTIVPEAAAIVGAPHTPVS
jgi:hypothetical protein